MRHNNPFFVNNYTTNFKQNFHITIIIGIKLWRDCNMYKYLRGLNETATKRVLFERSNINPRQNF